MLRDLLFPKFCCCCGYVGTYICTYCASKLSYFAPDVCIYCHRASAGGLTHPACCRRGGIQGFVTIFHYNTPLKRMSMRFFPIYDDAYITHGSLTFKHDKQNAVNCLV